MDWNSVTLLLVHKKCYLMTCGNCTK